MSLITKDLTLTEIEQNFLKLGARCCSCNEKLTRDSIRTYSHPDGWTVKGRVGPQWISFHCIHCTYDSSLGKLEGKMDLISKNLTVYMNNNNIKKE